MSFVRPSLVLTRRATREALYTRSARFRCRRYSSLVATEQERAIDDWIAQTQHSSRTYYDDLSPSKVADLYNTLPTRGYTDVDYSKLKGQSLPPLHSLIFFHARSPEEKLGVDKTDRDFCPPPPFTRRMWAGGVFRFPGKHGSNEALKVGEDSTARVKIEKIEKKGFNKGSPMVFVHQNVDYTPRGRVVEKPLVSEERIHVYLPRKLRANSRVVREVPGLPKPQYTFSWTPTPTTLFRFSALTWNGHLIHLDPEYSLREEGYPDRLVHGPLTALMLIEALYHKAYSGRIDNFVYRARNPTLVGRRQHLRGTVDQERKSAIVWSEDDDGVVGMTGTVDLLDPEAWKVE